MKQLKQKKKKQGYDYIAIFRFAIVWILFKLVAKYFSNISQNYDRARIILRLLTYPKSETFQS